jgi:hypothetical protein
MFELGKMAGRYFKFLQSDRRGIIFEPLPNHISVYENYRNKLINLSSEHKIASSKFCQEYHESTHWLPNPAQTKCMFQQSEVSLTIFGHKY